MSGLLLAVLLSALAPFRGASSWDLDGDGDCDLADFARFQACFTGEGGASSDPSCSIADFDLDGDIDLHDFGFLQLGFGAVGPKTVALLAAEPRQHHLGGGSRVVVFGEHFHDRLGLTINGAPVAALELVNSQQFTGLVPPNPPGVYDIVAEDASSGQAVAALVDAVEYVDAKLPPPGDVEATLVDGVAQLRWSNWTHPDAVEISRNGMVIAMLAGGATSFTDDLAGLPPGEAVDYQIVSTTAGIASYAADVAVAPMRTPCLETQADGGAPLARINLSGPSILLYASTGNEAQTLFHLSAPETAQEIKVLAARIYDEGALRCRIVSLADPNTTLRDFPMQDIPFSMSPSWTRGFHSGGALAPGDYILSFYADGSNSPRPIFALPAAASQADLGPPLHCPPYPAARARSFCGNIPPVIIGIEVKLVNPLLPQLSTEPLPGLGGGGSTARGGGGAANFGFQLVPILQANAYDPDGSVVGYRWTSSDTNVTISNSSTVAMSFFSYGAHDITLTVTDDSGGQTSFSKTIVALPYVAAKAAGDPPQFLWIGPAPSSRCFIPDIADPDVLNKFMIFITPSATTTIVPSSVKMAMIDPNDQSVILELTANDTFPTTPLNPGQGRSWDATFNMSDLPRRSSVKLRVRATDTDGVFGEQFFTIPLCPLQEYDTFLGVTTTVTYNPALKEYTVEVTAPRDPLYSSSFGVPCNGTTLSNSVEARGTVTMRLKGITWTLDNLKGMAMLKFMNSPLYSQTFEVSPTNLPPWLGNPTLSGGDAIWNVNDHTLLNQSWNVTPLNNQLCWSGSWLFGAVTASLRATISAAISANVLLDWTLTIRNWQSASPGLETDACVCPSLAVSGGGSGTAVVQVVGFNLLSVTGMVSAGVDGDFPARLRVTSPNVVDFDIADCVQVNASGRVVVQVKKLFVTTSIDTGWFGLFNSTSGACGASPCSCPARFESGAAGGGVLPEPPTLYTPSIAGSPDGQTALTVLLDTPAGAPGGADSQLHFAIDTGDGWSPPALIWDPPGDWIDSDPRVVFLSDSQALLVWVRNRLTSSEIESLSFDLAGLNELTANQEIYYALWDAASGWGPPLPLTDNHLPEGKPVLTSVPGGDEAYVAWVGYDLEYLFDADDNPVDHETSIYARSVASDGQLGPTVKVSAGDELNPASDSEPAIAFAANGDGYLFWVRKDATGRFLIYSSFANATGLWSPPAAAYSGRGAPVGVGSPSLALDAGGNGLLAFTTGPVDPGTGLHVGLGDAIQAAALNGGVLGGAVPVGPSRCIPTESTARGMQPTPVHLGETRWAVGYRALSDADGVFQPSGMVGLSTIDLGQPDPQWSKVHPLTENAGHNLDVAFAPGPNPNAVRAAWTLVSSDMTASAPAMADFELRPDLAIESLRLSDSHSPAGSEVALTISLKNTGLRAPSPMLEGTVIRIGAVVGGLFEEMSAIPLAFTAQPDQTQELIYTLIAPTGAVHLRVIADPLAEEVDVADNAADVMLGVSPPADLACEATGDGLVPRIRLTWTNADAYESILIYRDGRLRTELPGSATSHVDETVAIGDRVWSVRGRVGQSLSDPDSAVCVHTVRTKGDYDIDGDVDLADHAWFSLCESGPNMAPQPPSPETAQNCLEAFDFDADQDIDLIDFGGFQNVFTGAPPLEFEDFATPPAKWQIYSVAEHEPVEGVLRLVPSTIDHNAGTAFYNLAMPSGDFEVSFDFRLSNTNGTLADQTGVVGPDGFTFVVSGAPQGPASMDGFGLGYLGFPAASFAVEFDAFANNFDPGSNHAGVNRAGGGSSATVSVSPNFEETGWWHAVIRFQAGRLDVRLTPPSGSELSLFDDYPIPPANVPATKYIGFTAANGVNTANVDIDNVRIVPLN